MKTRLFLTGILGVALVFGFIGCGSKPEAAPPAFALGETTDLENALNADFEPIEVNGVAYTFGFGGGNWIGKVDGADAIGGTYTDDTVVGEDGVLQGSTLTLTQTQAFADGAWAAASGTDAVLVYTAGDPSTLVAQESAE